MLTGDRGGGGRFYPVGTLFIVLMLSVLMREYGPMLPAQRRAAIDHKVVGDNADPNQVSVDEVQFPTSLPPPLASRVTITHVPSPPNG
jgi:hypothetical protein